MAYAAILSLEEFRDEGRTEVRQRLHDHFDRWLQRVEDPREGALVHSRHPGEPREVDTRHRSGRGDDPEGRGALCTQLSHLERDTVHPVRRGLHPEW